MLLPLNTYRVYFLPQNSPLLQTSLWCNTAPNLFCQLSPQYPFYSIFPSSLASSLDVMCCTVVVSLQSPLILTSQPFSVLSDIGIVEECELPHWEHVCSFFILGGFCFPGWKTSCMLLRPSQCDTRGTRCPSAPPWWFCLISPLCSCCFPL